MIGQKIGQSRLTTSHTPLNDAPQWGYPPPAHRRTVHTLRHKGDEA